MSSVSVDSSDGQGEVDVEAVVVCFRFTIAISQFGVGSLSQVTEGRTWRG